MPQMSPMNWIILALFFIMVWYLFMSFIYFFHFPSFKKENTIKNQIPMSYWMKWS